MSEGMGIYALATGASWSRLDPMIHASRRHCPGVYHTRYRYRPARLLLVHRRILRVQPAPPWLCAGIGRRADVRTHRAEGRFAD
jgi:hypothetical protein